MPATTSILEARFLALDGIDAGHFVWEEVPAEYAAVIVDSIAGNVS